MAVIFEATYEYALSKEERDLHWPELSLNKNFKFTSKKTKRYNCVGWALGSERLNIDMLYFKEIHNLDKNNLDHSAKGYADILSKYYGYSICTLKEDNSDYDVIALFEDNEGDFKHAARLLDKDQWTSKMGNYEDISHELDAVSGDYYGRPKIFMRKKKEINPE